MHEPPAETRNEALRLTPPDIADASRALPATSKLECAYCSHASSAPVSESFGNPMVTMASPVP